MNFQFVSAHSHSTSLRHTEAHVLLLGITRTLDTLDTNPLFKVLDTICSGAVGTQVAIEQFQPEAGKTLVRALPNIRSQYVVLFGLGAGTPREMRTGLAAAFSTAKTLKAETVAICPLPLDACSSEIAGEIIGELATIASHNPLTYKTEKSGYKAPPEFETVKVVAATLDHTALNQGIERGAHIGYAFNFACDLTAQPANIITPRALRDLAVTIAETRTEGQISVEVLDAQDLKALNAQGILMVSRGSAEPPFLIELVYHPKEGPTEKALTLVGKAVTFDTGGNDIKPADGMRDMKRDKAGAANVIAAFQAIALMNVKLTVKAYFAPTENMIGERAYRPGDVFYTMSGRSVEVGNTDAEGRLTLVEAIEYAQRKGATCIVDVATLTGAAKMIGGDVAPVAFGNDDDFSALVVKAAAAAGEQISLQAMLEEIRKYNDSPIADICNVGGSKGAGAQTAAWFIREWVWPGVSWLHLDIANVAWKNERATGHSVRTLIALARLMANS